MTPLRAGLYSRVSTSGQDHALQLDELRRVAEQRGFLVSEYVDTASGGGNRLPERERMMADARAGRLDVVCCWRFDRFARSTRQLLDALDSFGKWKVEFISLREGIDTATATGRLVFTIVAALGEFERELIRERVRAGLAAAQRRGRHVGRPPRSFDPDRARALLGSGVGVKETARRLGVSPRTLRRRLGGRNPVSNPSGQGIEIDGVVDGPDDGGKR